MRARSSPPPRYTVKVLETIKGLTTQLHENVNTRVGFLFEHGYKMERPDEDLFLKAFQWPTNVKTFLSRSDEMQQEEKDKQEDILIARRDLFVAELQSVEKGVKKMEGVDDLDPRMVERTCARIAELKAAIEDSEKEAELVNEQETHLKLEAGPTDFATRIKDAQARKAPNFHSI